MVFFITLVVVSKFEMTDCLYMICVSSVSTWRMRALWLLRLLALWVNRARRVTCKLVLLPENPIPGNFSHL